MESTIHELYQQVEDLQNYVEGLEAEKLELQEAQKQHQADTGMQLAFGLC